MDSSRPRRAAAEPEPSPANPGPSQALTGRQEDLQAAVAAFKDGTHVAVFLLGDSGIGKSTLLEAVVAELAPGITAIRVHGSPSLANVPYGVLGPFIVGLPVQEATSQLAVLRTLWSHLEKEKRATQKPLMLIVDDAQYLDEATAGILAELAAAGWAKLLVSATARPGLPEPLLQLWFEGIAERLDLRPLTLAHTTDLLEVQLGQRVLPAVAEILWQASGGNPMLLSGLIADARSDGTLLQRNGVWLFSRPLESHGDHLTGLVRRQLLRRSPDERQALNLIALAEPVSRQLIEAVVGEEPVAALIEHELIRVSAAPDAELRLWHPVYGDALRNLMSPARSLQLRQSLLRLMDHEPVSAEGLLRQVSWSIECGADVEDRQLLRAAILASRLFQDDLARKAAFLVKDPELAMEARSVIARTHFNTDYAAARNILEADFGRGDTVASLLAGSLLWAVVLSALGHAPAEIMDRAEALSEAGERLAKNHPDDAMLILAAVAKRLETMRNMVYSLAGEYGQEYGEEILSAGATTPVEPESRGLEAAAAPASALAGEDLPAAGLDAAFRLSLDSERLLVQGKPLGAFALASRALEVAGTDHDELYYLTDFLVVRAAAAAVHAGDWQAAGTLLTRYTAGSGPTLISFGGGVHAAHGIILLYQGKARAALDVLSAALEALRLADPRQLFAATAAMAFAAAAEVGAKERAALFLADYDAAPAPVSRYLRTLSRMAVVYGKARLGNYPDAIAELRMLGRPDAARNTAGLELDALAFCLALGDRDSASRLLELQPGLEGPRAAALCAYAGAVTTNRAGDHLEAARSCEAAELWAFAALAYDAASHAYRASGDTLRERMASGQRKRCLERADNKAGDDAAGGDDPLGILTRRERDIVALAVRGLTDRQISAELQVSVRTVEGHLYRSYAKLNVKGREELPGIAGTGTGA